MRTRRADTRIGECERVASDAFDMKLQLEETARARGKLGYADGEQQSRGAHVASATEYIRAHLAENITLTYLANTLNLCYTYFTISNTSASTFGANAA